jgi:Ca-activated chloride channel family protein
VDGWSRLARIAPLLGLVAAGWLDPIHDRSAEGIEAYTEEKYGLSLGSFLEAQRERPDDPLLSFNVASALSRLGRHEEAIAAYEAAAADPQLEAEALYGAANSLFQMGKLPEAAELYKRSLRIDPNDEDAKHNLERVNELLEQMEQQQQEQQQQQQQEEQQGQQQEEQSEEQEQEEQQQSQQQPDSSGSEGEEMKSGEERPSKQAEMSEEDVERILAAFAEEEENKRQESLRKRRARPTGAREDW